jgi:hypothetical protein
MAGADPVGVPQGGDALGLAPEVLAVLSQQF